MYCKGRQKQENPLNQLFLEFPGGAPGIALLLLRSVFGVALCIEGVYYLGTPGAGAEALLLGFIALVAGVLLAVGYLTPIVASVAAIEVAATAVSWLPVSTPNILGAKPALVFALTILVALIGLGPGAYSLDARLFGRKEIIIPAREKRAEGLD